MHKRMNERSQAEKTEEKETLEGDAMNCYFEKINRNVQVFSVMGSMIKKLFV